MDPFSNNKCCINTVGQFAQRTADYYTLVKTPMMVLLNNAYQAQLYGKDSNEIFNHINDFHYLLVLLTIIADEMQQDSDRSEFINGGCPEDYGIDYYVEKYNIDCIVKHFMCSGIGFDIKNVLDLFGLNINNSEEDGIGYMYIQYNRSGRCSETRNIFRVS